VEEQHLQKERTRIRTRTSAGLRRRAEWRARRAQIVRAWTPTLIVCAYISVVCEALTFHVCACIFGLRIIYVGAFAFELRIFLERRHFE
jgi:hypothetical protein